MGLDLCLRDSHLLDALPGPPCPTPPTNTTAGPFASGVGLPLARGVFRDGLHPPARAIIRPRGGRPDAGVGVWAGGGGGMGSHADDPPRIDDGCVRRYARSHTRYCCRHRNIRRGAGHCAPTPSENRGWPTQTPTTIIGRIHIGVQIRRHHTSVATDEVNALIASGKCPAPRCGTCGPQPEPRSGAITKPRGDTLGNVTHQP